MDKPLFIPLKTEYYEDFLSGDKGIEFRRYGPRWNEQTCVRGRKLVLSKGYGKKNRVEGVVGGFWKKHIDDMDPALREVLLSLYPEGLGFVACIGVKLND